MTDPLLPPRRVHLSPPDTGPLEEQYVVAAVRSGWVAPVGPDLDAFEREVAAVCGRQHAVAVSSGTAALHLALLAWGVGPGDVVVTATLTFAATANAIVYTGAQPCFVDALPDGTMDPALLEQALRQQAAAGRRVAAVVPVDLLGRCPDHRAVRELARAHGVPVLSDAAESLGARHAGRPAGSWGDAAVLSFNGNKIMTTSGGGMLLTDDAALAARVRYLATQARQPVPHYEHTEIGYNYRLSNLLAALGRAQLVRLPQMLARRRSRRQRYADLVAGWCGVEVFQGEDDADDNCWLTAVLVDPEQAGWQAGELGRALDAADVESRPLWKPMHQQPVFRSCDAVLSGVADRLYATGLALPSGSALTAQEHDRVDAVVAQFLEGRGTPRTTRRTAPRTAVPAATA